MPLVSPKSGELDSQTHDLLEFFKETLGFTPNSVSTMAHRPKIAKAFVQLNMAVMENHGRVTSGLKRLIGYMTSRITGCLYCQAHTIRAAERYGAGDEKLENIWSYQDHPAFSEAERVALDFAVAASSIPNGVNKELRERLHKHWDDGEIVEILAVISLFGYLNRWNDSMATTLEEGAEESGVRWLNADGWSKGKHQ